MQFATLIGVLGLVVHQTAALLISKKDGGPFVDSLDCYRKDNQGTKYRGLKTTTASGRTCQNWKNGMPHQDSVRYLNNDFGTGNHNFCRNPETAFGEPWCFTTDPTKKYERETCGVPECTKQNRNFAEDANSFKAKVSADMLHCDCADALYGSTVTTKDTRVALAQHTVKGMLVNGKCVCDQSLLAAQQVRGIDTNSCYDKSDGGKGYIGLVTSTGSGRTCANWNDHASQTGSHLGNHNYCRNPGAVVGLSATPSKPWCFTKDPNVKFEECTQIPECPGKSRDFVDDAAKLHSHMKTDGLDCKCADQLYGSAATTADTAVKPVLAQRQLTGKIVNGKCVCDTSLLAHDTRELQSGVDDTHCYTADGKDYKGLATVTQSGRTCKNWVQSGVPAEGNHNYCRNPDGTMPTPWCFTVDPKVEKEACNIPKCPENPPSYVDKANDLKDAIKKDPAPDCKCADQLYGSTMTTKDTKVPVAFAQNGKMINGKCVCGAALLAEEPHLGVQSLSDKDFDSSCYSRDGPQGTSGGAKGRSYRGLVATTVSGRTCQKWTDAHPWDATSFAPVQDDDSSGALVFGNGVGNHNYCRNPDQSHEKPWCFTTDPNEAHKIELCEIPECPTNVRDFKEEAASARLGAGKLNCDCADYLYGSTKTTKDTRIALSQRRQTVGKMVNGRCVCPGGGDGGDDDGGR